ncbi:Kinetochore protein Sos7 like [Verticillium longisporum]
MTTIDADDILKKLEALERNSEISIIKLSEPISSAYSQDARQRTSDASNASLDAPTPASLDADLQHYKELFSKLRFSYVEQVTKEKFIRAIVGDPPHIVTPQENLELEKQNLAAKTQLKALKIEVADMVAELEKRGRDLSQRYDNVRVEKVKLQELPGQIEGLESRIAELKETQEPGTNPYINLPLAKTLELLDDKRRRQKELDRELEQLQSRVPRKRKEVERLEAELQPLEVKKQTSTTAAKDAKRRKEAALGGVEDDLEERGRWLRATEAALTNMLELK